MITSSPSQAYYLNLEDARSSKLSPDGTSVYVLHNQGLTSINLLTGEQLNRAFLTDGSDFEFLPDGRLVIATARGLLINNLLQTGSKVGGTLKVRSGLLFHKIGNTVYLLDATFKITAQQTVGVTSVADFEFKDNVLYMGGYQQAKFNTTPVQIAYVYRYKLEGGVFKAFVNDSRNQGKIWGYGADQLGDNFADTRIERLHIHQDKLYVLGAVAGGNNIFRWNGVDLTTNTLSSIDANSTPAGIPPTICTYIGIVDLATFTVIKGQLAFVRLDTGKGNTLQPKVIYAEDNGVFVGSRAAFQIPDRPTRLFAGKPLPAYTGNDTSLKQYNLSLSARQWVTPGRGDPILFNGKVSVMRVSARDLAQTKPVQLQASDNNTYIIIW